MTDETKTKLADDLLEGAGAIAVFVYGDKKKRRKVYRQHELKQIPTFQLDGGQTIFALKSILTRGMAEGHQLYHAAAQAEAPEPPATARKPGRKASGKAA